MIKLFKNIAIISLLIAFLLPASGVLVFMHHCDARNTTELSLDGSNSCCKTRTGIFREVAGNPCEIVHGGHCTHHTFISKESCCKDTSFFVKISLDYLASVSKTFQAAVLSVDLPDFSYLKPVIHISLLRGEVSDSPDPPGTDTYLFTSSLRL